MERRWQAESKIGAMRYPPSLARVVVVDPGYGYGYGYGPQNYSSPYGGYAYAPGYGARSWDNPGADDVGAPYSPCYPTQRAQNRC